jgi:hypothetical protein
MSRLWFTVDGLMLNDSAASYNTVDWVNLLQSEHEVGELYSFQFKFEPIS